LKLKAKLESSSSYCSVKRFVPGGFNVGLKGHPAPPYQEVARDVELARLLAYTQRIDVAAQVEFESKV